MSIRLSHGWFASLILLLTGVSACAEEPAPEVPVARAVMREWTDYEDFTGRIEAASRVDLRARATGYLVKTLAKEGAQVKKGDLLFEIDPRPYRAELDKAEAAVKLAEARLKLADINLKRAKTQLAQQIIGQEEFDRTAAERDVAEAEVKAAQAARMIHRLNVEFTRVLSPLDGQVGRLAIDPGNLIMADQTILATLVSRDPMYVFFDIDERSLLRLRLSRQEDKGKTEKPPIAVGLAGEEGFPRRAVLDFTDNQVDPKTGTLCMRAVLPNKDGLLMPGLFVRVRLAMGAPHKVLAVPEQAVLVEMGERFVYVVNDKNVIEQRAVKMGPSGEGLRVVTRGLKADERVVIGRLHKLQPGMSVRPHEEKEPAPKAKPSPDGGPASAAPSARGQGGPGILVEAAYPGASAEVVSESVRAPIEQQVNGVEKLRLMRSRCTSDGKYALSLTFARGVDWDMAQVLVQNRVALAMPTLPSVVQYNGISVKKGPAGVLAIVTLSSADGRRDRHYLSNCANIHLKDELARLPGVANVTLLGETDPRLRIRLDPDRLAALGIDVADVARAVKKQNQASVLDVEKRWNLMVRGIVSGLDVEKLSNLIVKSDGEGRVVRLKDVANVEFGAGAERSWASYNGKPAAALVVRTIAETTPRETRSVLQKKLSELNKQLPPSLDLAVSFDFTTDAEYLLLDLDVPAANTAEFVWQILGRCQTRLHPVQGVQDVLAMSENPFDVLGGGPCLLVGLTPAKKRKSGRDEIAQALRQKLDEIKELSVRVRDLSAASRSPSFGYPIGLAVRGLEAARVRNYAKQLAARLGKDNKLTDVWANPDSELRVQRTVEIDRPAAAARGVSVEDIFAALQMLAGSFYVSEDLIPFDRPWRVQMQAGSGSGDWVQELRKLKVRGAKGQMIPLNVVVKVHETEAPRALDFLDSWPMVEITANPSSGVKLEEARKRCETLAEEVRKEMRLPKNYRLVWLP
jgi:membrane fusion protein, multidrug efflux system